MTNTTPNPAADVAQIRALFDSQQRLVGTLVNEMQDLKQDLQERDRQLADIYSRLEDQGQMDKVHIELMDLWAERLSMLERVVVSMIEDFDDRTAFVKQVQPLSARSNRNLRAALSLADRIAAPPAPSPAPAPERWSN